MSEDIEDKPLHVQVAEAIGWHGWIRIPTVGELHAWIGRQPHEEPLAGYGQKPPHYDTDWSAIGPLQVRFGIAIAPRDGRWIAYIPTDSIEDEGLVTDHFDDSAAGTTGLIAICNLIIALHVAGKLTPKI